MIKNLIKFLMFIAIIFIIGCNSEENDSPPIYQEAIYTINVDGSNNHKVCDVDGYDTVQFIPNSDQLIFVSSNELYTISEDGSDLSLISQDIEVQRTNLGFTKPSIDSYGEFVLFTGRVNDQLDIYLYDKISNSLSNLTNSIDRDEFNPRFGSNSTKACFVTQRDTLFDLCTIDVVDSNIDTLYSSTNRIPGCAFSTDNENLYFFEEFSDFDPSNRDYYRASLKEYDLNSSEIVLITDNSSNFGSNMCDLNSQNIVCSNYLDSSWEIISLLDYAYIQLSDFEINYLDIDNNNLVYYSSGLSVDSADIKIFDTDTGSTVELVYNAISPSLDILEERLCYFGRYNTNVKRKLILN